MNIREYKVVKYFKGEFANIYQKFKYKLPLAGNTTSRKLPVDILIEV